VNYWCRVESSEEQIERRKREKLEEEKKRLR
jgi:hypothetical protein